VRAPRERPPRWQSGRPLSFISGRLAFGIGPQQIGIHMPCFCCRAFPRFLPFCPKKKEKKRKKHREKLKQKQVIFIPNGACEMNWTRGHGAACGSYWPKLRATKSQGHAMATTPTTRRNFRGIEALKGHSRTLRVQCATVRIYLRDGHMTPLGVCRLDIPGVWKAKGKKPVKNGDLWKERDVVNPCVEAHGITWIGCAAMPVSPE